MQNKKAVKQVGEKAVLLYFVVLIEGIIKHFRHAEMLCS